MLSRLLNRKDARCGHSRQPSRQGEGGDAQRSAVAWRIWARFRQISHLLHTPGMCIAESTCSVPPLSACQNQNVQNFVLSQNPNISMNFSGQRHCLASGMCKICAINIFRNIWPAMQASLDLKSETEKVIVSAVSESFKIHCKKVHCHQNVVWSKKCSSFKSFHRHAELLNGQTLMNFLS